MFRIRYYNKVFHPDEFRDGGWRGFVIRLLNSWRWRLEVVVQRQVLAYFTHKHKLTKSRGRELRRAFALDVASERLEKEKTSPLLQTLEVESATPTHSGRYAYGAAPPSFGPPAPLPIQRGTAPSAATIATPQLPVRPLPLDNLAAAYGGDPRARRYARGGRYTVLDPEGDFEEIEPADPKGDA